jgi:hypothetical protein
MALKTFAEASAITEMRPVMTSRPQESQALTHSKAIKQTDIKTMTDLISTDTVKRLSMNIPPGSLFGSKW